jgi:hypothetical protein
MSMEIIISKMIESDKLKGQHFNQFIDVFATNYTHEKVTKFRMELSLKVK